MPFIVLYWFIEILREIFLRLARPIHPWTTYDNLATRTLFPTLTYHDLSTHTAPYSGRTTITNPPRFSYYDPHIRAHVLSRYRTAIQRRHLEKQACPPDVEYLWKGVLGHIKDTPYTDEGWVGSLMDSVVSVLRPLVRDMSDPGASLKMEYPKLFASQRGDRNLVLMKGADGIGEGLKTTAVLNRYWPDFSGALILEEGKLTDAKAVLMKLGIQLLLLQEAGVQNVRFGLIITGLECYVVELAATTLHGQHLRGVAISDPIELSNSSMFSDGGVQSVVTLILGLLMPPSIVPYHEDRDPAHHAPPSDWTGLRKLITDQVLRRVGGGGGVGGRGGIGDEGLRGRSHGNEGPGAGDRRTLSEGGKDQREQCPSALSKGTFLELYRPPSKYFDLPQSLLFIELEDLIQQWDIETDLESSSSRSPSPAPSLTSSSSRSSQENSSSTPPSSFSGENVKSSVWSLHLAGQHSSGYLAAVTYGILREHEGTQNYPVILKMYDTSGFQNLKAEAWAYKTLQELQGTEVAAQIGMVAPAHWSWAGLLMEDVGTSLGCGDNWDVLTPIDKLAIYQTLRKIHLLGVRHGDVAPRNVVRRLGGTLAFIDFGNASEHCCSGGDSCRELTQLRKELCIP